MGTTVQIGITTPIEGQSQGEVTVSDALATLDACAFLSVKDRTLLTPPGSPADGDRYLMPATGTLLGLWSTFSNNRVVVYRNGWVQLAAPKEGWRTYIDNEDIPLLFNGTAWVETGAGSYNSFGKVGTSQYEAYYFANANTSVAMGTLALTANRLYAVPYTPHFRSAVAIDRIQCRFTVNAGNVRMGIYKDSATNPGYPGTLVADLGAAAVAANVNLTISQALNPGRNYWLCIVCDGAPTIAAISGNAAAHTLGVDNTLTNLQTFLHAAFTYGALPGIYPSTPTVGLASFPGIAVRYSA